MKTSNRPSFQVPASFVGVCFVTLRQRDALPESFGQNLALQYYSKQAKFAPGPDHSACLSQARKQLFARYDHALDVEKYGQGYLREPLLAQIVADEIHSRDGVGYKLLAFTILPNHVHLLLDLGALFPEEPPPLNELESARFQPLREVVGEIQKATEAPLKQAMQQLGALIDHTRFQKHNSKGGIKSERSFWHENTFDFRVEDAVEFEKVVRFILRNPVKAELVDHWMDWPFSFWKG